MVLHLPPAADLGPARLSGTAAALLLSWWVARSFWSWYRLRHIPGPALGRVSAAWLLRKLATGKFHEHMCKVSEDYGAFDSCPFRLPAFC